MNFYEINNTERYNKWREETIQYMQMLGYTPKEVLIDFDDEEDY